MKKCIVSLFFIVCLFINSFGQQTAQGCLLDDNIVYTDKQPSGLINLLLAIVFGGKPVYSSLSAIPLNTNCSNWSPASTGVPCKVCQGQFSIALGLITGCDGVVKTGEEGTFTMVNCDLDYYTYLLCLSMGAFGALAVGKRQRF